MSSYTQKPGTPLVARAIFGERGTGYTNLTRWEMRSHRITDRIQDHTDHYVGGQFTHRETDTRYETRYEDRMTDVGVDQIEHETSRLEFEYAENHSMEVRKPWWGHKGDLLYVASHRGVGSYVYDLHSADGRHVTEIHPDVVPEMRLLWPFLAGCAVLGVQTQLLHLSPSWKPAAIAGCAWIAFVVVHRAWRGLMLALSRRRARRIVRRLVTKDDRDAVRATIRQRVYG